METEQDNSRDKNGRLELRVTPELLKYAELAREVDDACKSVHTHSSGQLMFEPYCCKKIDKAIESLYFFSHKFFPVGRDVSHYGPLIQHLQERMHTLVEKIPSEDFEYLDNTASITLELERGQEFIENIVGRFDQTRRMAKDGK